VHNSELYIYGGFGRFDAYADIWKYNTQSDWQMVSAGAEDLFDPPIQFQIAYVPRADGVYYDLFMIGGSGGSRGGYTNVLYKYQSDVNRWSTIEAAPMSALGGSMVYHQQSNSLYLVSGYPIYDYYSFVNGSYYTWKYQIDSGTWIPLAPRSVSQLRSNVVGVHADNDQAVVFGGTPRGHGMEDTSGLDCFASTLQVLDIGTLFNKHASSGRRLVFLEYTDKDTD
jgi:N-acetylneuraminic acid mutarotase